MLTLVILLWHYDCLGTSSKYPSLTLQALLQVIHPFVKGIAIHWLPAFGDIRLKGRILEVFTESVGWLQSNQSLHFLWSWPQMAEGNHETGCLLSSGQSHQDNDERGV
jgi:hypothetical protein